jgi:hypothetical protein
MGKYPIAIIPFAGLSPAACTALAAAIDDALEVFGRWQLPTGMSTRLLKARGHLMKVARQDSYGATPDELYETAKAILLANDFYLISRTLKEDRADPIAEELKVALGGTLREIDTKKKSAFDIQSQFWFGMVLAYSGLHPAVPDSKKRRPDFLINVGTLSCGVEIKRPKAPETAWRAVSSAASQLNEYGLPGVIVLDLTRCVNADELILHKGPLTARQIVKRRFYPLVNQLTKAASGYSRSDKFDRIILLKMYARFFNWTFGCKDDADFGFFFKSIVLPEACCGLVTEQSERIQSLMLHGFERASGNPLSLKSTWK